MQDPTVRLDKYLANVGITSRRNIKTLLKEKTVSVNDKRVRESGFRINPHKDTILINGQKIKSPSYVYYIINKPKGIISTTSDEFNRQNVISLIRTELRIYPVGRLDKDTTGLLLLTNDGTFTNLLTHPSFHVPKTYRLTIKGAVSLEQLHALRTGVLLEDGITAPAQVTVKKNHNPTTILEVILHEGKNRQIRRMCETVGIDLIALKRIQFGSVKLGNIAEGQSRELTKDEVQQLKNAARQK